jgi:hypothetical protein
MAKWIANDWKNAGFDASFFGRTFRATWNTANTTVPKVVQGLDLWAVLSPHLKPDNPVFVGNHPSQ